MSRDKRLRLCFTCHQPGHIAANCSHGYRPPQPVQAVQYIPVAPSAAPQLMYSQPAAVTGNPQAVLLALPAPALSSGQSRQAQGN